MIIYVPYPRKELPDDIKQLEVIFKVFHQDIFEEINKVKEGCLKKEVNFIALNHLYIYNKSTLKCE